MSKTYILQQDYNTPEKFIPKGSESTITKNDMTIGCDYYRFKTYNSMDQDVLFSAKLVEYDSGAWFKLKQDESIKVSHFGEDYIQKSYESENKWYHFRLSKQISAKKYPHIISAIETVINNNSEWVDLIDDFNNNNLYTITDMKYTDKDMEEQKEKAFNAGSTYHQFSGERRYKTYQDYKKHLEQGKPFKDSIGIPFHGTDNRPDKK